MAGLGLAERRSVMLTAAESLLGFGEAIHEASDAELGELMGEADAMAARAAAVRAVRSRLRRSGGVWSRSRG